VNAEITGFPSRDYKALRLNTLNLFDFFMNELYEDKLVQIVDDAKILFPLRTLNHSFEVQYFRTSRNST
jgi:hypothetical protein